MSASAIAMMILMLGIFWGGFATLLVVALRRRTTRHDGAVDVDEPLDRNDERLD